MRGGREFESLQVVVLEFSSLFLSDEISSSFIEPVGKRECECVK